MFYLIKTLPLTELQECFKKYFTIERFKPANNTDVLMDLLLMNLNKVKEHDHFIGKIAQIYVFYSNKKKLIVTKISIKVKRNIYLYINIALFWIEILVFS